MEVLTVLSVGFVAGIVAVAAFLFILLIFKHRIIPTQCQGHFNESERKQNRLIKSTEETISRQEETVAYGELPSSEDGAMLLRQRNVYTSPPMYKDPPPPYTKDPSHENAHCHAQKPQKEETSRAFLESLEMTTPKLVIGAEYNGTEEESIESSKAKLEEATSDEEDQSQCDSKNRPKVPSLGKSSETETIIQTYMVESPTEPFSFEVDEKGCSVAAPYCKLQFPPGATKNPLQIKMTPEYKIYATKANQISICPVVNFESDKELAFEQNVSVGIHTNYTAVDGKVQVQVMRRKDCDSPFEPFRNVKHGDDRYITFDVKHFCGYSVVADESQLPNMQRHYLSAMYMREPRHETRRYLHWLIYEDCPALMAQMRSYLKERSTIIDPELFALRYNYKLQLTMGCEGVSIGKNNQHVPLSDKWGTRVSESFQFKVIRHETETYYESDVQYELLALHTKNQAVQHIMQKTFFLEWACVTSLNTEVTASGSGAVGIMNNFYGTDGRTSFQQQTSEVSNASSGYSSELQTPLRSVAFFPEERSGACEHEPSPVVQQSQIEEVTENLDEQDSLLDNDESFRTIPKTESCASDNFLSSPLAQSTPSTTRVETVPKEREEKDDMNTKSFSE